ncbi:M23 family metallopeptidase [Mechercharimyces sp. CAU 1602]|uniref:M23 family metallopeptidase n=1 Tax=Mechercharimyces sp. CAU 1602 TaxID=2973933 RepID=UPI002161B11A|nr:M23 family metallopeptidase [Mechercharimyces sp. CAU 1602]MCS1351792.1 M23 family metallopeptidase [Mechercharimyces sp. CAU 1602]
MFKQGFMVLLSTIISFSLTSSVFAVGENDNKASNESDARKALFESVELVTGVPWSVLAAIDQYERNLQRVRRDLSEKEGLISITIPPSRWSGELNPDSADNEPASIQFFTGIGQDGDGDGKADQGNEVDVTYTIARYLSSYGVTAENIRIGLWQYYQHPLAVDIITHMSKVYQQFNSLELDERTFVMPMRYNYTYHSTFGDRRGFGGLRIHEGTDIFADYGTPVLSPCYGYIELKGWNRFGGWRVGIRDLNNNYHYFAHLSSFDKKIAQGQVVEPGSILGYVGSSGYGPPGTSGKFPPHLHYGIYKFNGKTTYAFNPYPYLRNWERASKRRSL